jgi:predicted transcriptional regulator
MENKNGEHTNKDVEEKDKTKSKVESKSKHKKKVVAKDLVKLKHVEVKKQQLSQEAMDLARTLKEQILEHDRFERLSNDELTILESIMDKRLFLTRIAIIANQSRIPLGIEPFKKADLEKILDKLISKGYIEIEKVGEDLVYYLTERGKYRIQ